MDSIDRAKKKSWKAEERRRARAAFPLPDADLAELFDEVARQLDDHGCDDTRRFTDAWARARSSSVELLNAWLDDNGGFCDCEVLANVAPHWDDNRLREADA
jgi:hypothetical protein